MPFDDILKIVTEHGVRADDTKQVVVSLVKVAMPIIGEPPETKYSIDSGVDAQFSMAYGAAIATLRGKASINDQRWEDL